MATITKDLGVATAYGYAVAGGYTGTEEEFAELMASYASVAQEAEESAETAEAYAKGTVDGTPVGSGETGYHDNAKYYAEQASGSATDADNSATAASGSASGASASALKSEGHAVGQQNGSDVGSGSPYYHNNAKYYKEQASGSATAASGSAGTAAEQALVSEGYAKGTQSGTPVASGTYYHDNAKYYKEQADGDASSASASATAANTDALKAEGFAVGKQNGADVGSGSPYYENNAKYYASEAADSAAEAAASAASIDPDTLAKVDGYYESMTVGNAEQLVATVGVEDSVPFNFRTTGGSADVGDRKTMEVVGGTVAWNQMLKEQTSKTSEIFTYSTDESITKIEVSSTPTAAFNVARLTKDSDNPKPFIKDHKYLASINLTKVSKSSAEPFYIYLYGMPNTSPVQYYFLSLYSNITEAGTYAKIVNCPENADEHQTNIGLWYNHWAVGDEIEGNAILVDLTQMFGSTIADYIYSLEQANAGAGVAWFRKLFPKPYYAYNAGELMSVKTSAYKSVGFNQWDEEWELGYYKSDGTKDSSNSNICCKNRIKVLPNTTYYVKIPYAHGLRFFALDSSGTMISDLGYVINQTLTTPVGCAYLVWYTNAADDVTSYSGGICINLHWDGERDGEYEPYETHTYALDSDLELRGIPKLDADNQLYYDGDTYKADGTVDRRFGIVDMGELAWYMFDTTPDHYWFRATLPFQAKDVASSAKPNMLCSAYKTETPNNIYTGVQGISKTATYNYVVVCDMNYSDAATFKAAMSGHKFICELETPSEETADPFQTPQIVNDFGTEEFVDARTIPIPVGHNSKYQANLRAKLEMAPNSPSGDGDYIVRQSGGQNTYVPITFPADELPAAPTTDGNYVLKCTVSSGTATFTWEAQT